MKIFSALRLYSIPLLLLGVLLVATFLSPVGNKYDTTPQMVMVLIFAAITLFIGFFSFFNKNYLLYGNFPGRCRNLLKIIDGFIKIFLTFFLVWVVISFFYSQTSTFGFPELLVMLSGGLLFFSLKPQFLAPSLIYKLFSFILIVTSFCGYIFYFTSHHSRAFGLFYNPAFKTDAWPNAFALFVILLWPFLFSVWWRSKKMVFAWLLTFMLAVVFSSFVLSFSRAGLLVFIFQIIILLSIGLYFTFVQKERVFSYQKVFMIVGCVMLTVLLVAGAQYGRQVMYEKTTLSFSDKAQFKNGEETTSVRERADFMKGGLQLALKEPFFGYGPMSFSYVYRSIQTDWLAIADHPHNVFIKIAVENGIPASFFFLMFLFLLFIKSLFFISQLSKSGQFFLLMAMLAFIGGIAHNLVDYNFNFITNFVIFWIILAIVDRLYAIDQVEHVDSKTIFSRFITINTVFTFISFLLVFVFFSMQVFYTGLSFLAKRDFLETEKVKSILAEKMLYPRYFLLDQAAESSKQKKTLQAEQYFLLHIEKNKWDAMAYSQIGNYYLLQRRFDDALQNFKKALELDKKNVWAYYLQYLQLLHRKKDVSSFLAVSEKLVQEFEQYTPKVEANIHFTAQNSNSKDALEVLRLVMRHDKTHRLLFTSYFDRISAAREAYALHKNSQ